jgi:hypothetical protein
MIEINAAPDRATSNDVNARAAAAAGVRDPRQLRRPQHRQPRARPVGDRDGAARLADRRRRRQHTPWAEFAPLRKRAQARVSR